MPNTTINGLPYPASTDAPNVPLHIQNLAQGIDSRAVPRFASTTARNAAITTPVDGMMCTVNGFPMFYRAGQWRGTITTSASQTTFFLTEIYTDVETGVATLTVNDPGWPYILDVSATVMISADSGTGANVRVRLDSMTGAIVSHEGARAAEQPTWSPLQIPLATFPTATLTGNHSLIVTARRTVGFGGWSVPTGGSLLNAIIRPSYA